MPTYSYLCQSCSKELEVKQSIHDSALTDCPSCGGRLKKLFAVGGIAFKGSGFYRTDSRSTDKPGSAPQKTKPAEKPASSKPSSTN